MYQLKKFNVIKIAGNEAKKEEYLSQGYELIEEKEEGSGEKSLEEMTLEELTAYAKENNIDIGNSTSAKGILKKITEALNGGGEDGAGGADSNA
ncbi:MAG: hypothetical protein VB018_09420 [Lachnospiraceae bacterium]|nr:hypothetical protein [Lachnospiraceae bacterium]